MTPTKGTARDLGPTYRRSTVSDTRRTDLSGHQIVSSKTVSPPPTPSPPQTPAKSPQPSQYNVHPIIHPNKLVPLKSPSSPETYLATDKKPLSPTPITHIVRVPTRHRRSRHKQTKRGVPRRPHPDGVRIIDLVSRPIGPAGGNVHRRVGPLHGHHSGHRSRHIRSKNPSTSSAPQSTSGISTATAASGVSRHSNAMTSAKGSPYRGTVYKKAGKGLIKARGKSAYNQPIKSPNLPKIRHRFFKQAAKKVGKEIDKEKATIAEPAQQQQQQQQPPPPTQVQSQPKQYPRESSQSSSNLRSKTQESLLNIHRLQRDGRKTPDQYRKTVMAASSPSQLSLKSISEYYNIPDVNFATADDVFRYRGYKKLSKIDEGAFGVVSKAVRLSDKLLVAVKEVDLRRKKAKRIEEMKRELFVLQKIDNNNVVKLIEHFIIGQMLVIIMEYCAGSNLTTFLKETAINEQEAQHLFKQMSMAIKVLHKKGIAHRDVKLNNFLLDSTRKMVKIGDFGLSVVSYKHAYGVTMAKTYCGTEPYMAPEILRRNSLGVRSYNPLYADIWSLGVCLFAMLTRTFPFKMQSTQGGLYRAQVTRRWRFPRSLRDTLSEEIRDLVWHMLDPEPERRITISGVVAHPWLNNGQLVVLSHDEPEPVDSSPQPTADNK